MTHDPVYDKLARFTLNSASPDPAEILFYAGRASARTPWGWKVTVVGLLLANVALVGLLLFRDSRHPRVFTPSLEPVAPVIIGGGPGLVPIPVPSPSLSPVESASPWSFGALHRVTDPNDLPQTTAVEGFSRDGPSLTPRSHCGID
jgi:hypothetical protein